MTDATLSCTSSFLRFFGEGRPVAGAVLEDNLDLTAENAAGGIDLLDGQLFGLNRTGFADRHRSSGRVQLAHGHGVFGHGQPGRIDLGGREITRRSQDRGRRRHQQPDAQLDPVSLCHYFHFLPWLSLLVSYY